MSSKLPTLVEFLTADEWGDGSRRERGTILVIWEEGRWKAWLNDRAQGRQAWLSGATLTDVAKAADKGLREGTIDWRAIKPGRR